MVFDSADIDSAVEGVVDAIWFNQGQVGGGEGKVRREREKCGTLEDHWRSMRMGGVRREGGE